jgi:2-hydroxychromene-2-carboxylate isomerase
MTHAERLDRLEPFALAAMRECFRAGRELSEVEDLIAIARSLDLDFDAAVLRSAINSKPVKATLLMAHDEAMRAGVVGVPSITVAGRIFWGEDRLDEALAAAAA